MVGSRHHKQRRYTNWVYQLALWFFSINIKTNTHPIQNSSSCIDIIFTDQPNLVINSGIKPSLHENCHHQITYAKFNLQIIYPPPYQRLVWDYKNANASSIQKALNMIDWNKLFSNANVWKTGKYTEWHSVQYFFKLCKKVITINDRDPPWINEKIKCKIKSKNNTFRQYLKNVRKNCLKWYEIGKKGIFMTYQWNWITHKTAPKQIGL